MLMITFLRYSADKKLFCASGNDIQVWNLQTLSLVTTLRTHTGSINALAAAEEHHWLFSSSSDDSVVVSVPSQTWHGSKALLMRSSVDMVYKDIDSSPCHINYIMRVCL